MNKETFKQTYLPLSASMYRTAYRILGNPEDAEDMVQEAYMKLWKQRDTHPGIFQKRQGSHSPNRSRHSFHGRPGRRWHTRTPQR